MKRRTIGLIVTLALCLAPLAADAQPPKKLSRIGYLAPAPRTASGGIDAFREGLRELGYVEGQHIAIEARYTEGKDERARDLATELVQRGVDLVVAVSTAQALAAKQATSTIPIVFVGVGDPVARGLVTSIARPGGNLTGVGPFSSLEVTSKRLELLLQAVPGVTRVAVLRHKSPTLEELPRSSVDMLQEAARALGVALQLLHVHSPDDIEDAFAAMTRERAEALLLLSSPFFAAHEAKVLRLVAESRLPASVFRSFVHQGGLMSYGTKAGWAAHRGAAYVDKILRGALPAELPVEQGMGFELVINLKTAKALGLTISPTLLSQADEVIQ
ncbi:MAG TPA: ABC transporter substrate-binding protein [Candidatus Methylomirabilis sp.]